MGSTASVSGCHTLGTSLYPIKYHLSGFLSILVGTCVHENVERFLNPQSCFLHLLRHVRIDYGSQSIRDSAIGWDGISRKLLDNQPLFIRSHHRHPMGFRSCFPTDSQERKS